MEDLVFRNIRLSATSSLLKATLIKGWNMVGSLFSNITSDQTSDFSNVLVDLSGATAPDDFVIEITSATIVMSNISILKVSIPVLPSGKTRRIALAEIEVSDCIIDYNIDLIRLYNLESDEDFTIVLDRVNFNNLRFISGGTIMNLQHQTLSPLIWKNSVIYGITYAGARISAFDMTGASIQEAKVTIQNLTAYDIDAKEMSFIETREAAILEVYDSDISFVSNILAGAVLQATSGSSVSIFNTRFYNNTSVKGAAFSLNGGSNLMLDNSTVFNNCAISSGVINTEDNAHFELIKSNFYNNYAYHAAVSEIFSTVTPSIIDNCTIENNIALSETEFQGFIQQDYIPSAFREYIQNHESLFVKLPWAYSIELLLGSLAIKNGTVLTNQPNALYSVYSTLEVDGMQIRDTQLDFAAMLLQQGTGNLKNMNIFNITSLSSALEESYIMSMSDFTFDIENVEYSNSTGNLLEAFYSQGNITNMSAFNVEGMFLLYLKSSQLFKFENSLFESIITSHEYTMRFSKSEVGSIRNVTLDSFNNMALYFKDSTVKAIEKVTISNIQAAIHAVSSTLESIDSLKVIN